MEEQIYFRCFFDCVYCCPTFYQIFPPVSSDFSRKSQAWKIVQDHWVYTNQQHCKEVLQTSRELLAVKEEDQQLGHEHVLEQALLPAPAYMPWLCKQLVSRSGLVQEHTSPSHKSQEQHLGIGMRWEVFVQVIILEELVATLHPLVILLYLDVVGWCYLALQIILALNQTGRNLRMRSDPLLLGCLAM